MTGKLSVVVVTREPDKQEELKKNIIDTAMLGLDIFFVVNPNGVGLPVIYNKMLNDENVNKNEIIVFMHDDIELLKKGWASEIYRMFNEHKEYGIIGVAGSAQFDENGAWWQYEKKYGQVLHRHEGNSWLTTFSPLLDKDLQDVCVIDGLFMAIDVKRVGKQFDENLAFDFYDICFCLDNYLAKNCKIGVTTNIRIAHSSIGQMRQGWYAAREYANKKYADKFPIDLELAKNKGRKR